jgi:hypothetical protein
MMTISYSFDIVRLNTIDTEDYSKIVKEIEYRYKGVDQDTNVSYCVEDKAVLDTDSISSFVEFADLTEETVTLWLNNTVSEDSIADWQNIIENNISARLAKPTAQKSIPWENNQ